MELPQKILGEKIALQLNNFTQKVDTMFCGLGEEERTKIRKKKKEKKEINLIAAKSGLVGMKGSLKVSLNPSKKKI